jgi:hypothetical protein
MAGTRREQPAALPVLEGYPGDRGRRYREPDAGAFAPNQGNIVDSGSDATDIDLAGTTG